MKQFFFLLLLGVIGIIRPKGEAMRLDPESHALLSDPGYSKHIEVQSYLVTREQLGELFSKKEATIVQLPNSKLRENAVYLLVRCKNKGEYAAAGELRCFIPNRGSPIFIDISDLPGNMGTYADSVIYVGKGLINNNNELPKIKYEWDCLYTM